MMSFKTSQWTSAGLYIVYVSYRSAEWYSIHVGFPGLLKNTNNTLICRDRESITFSNHN